MKRNALTLFIAFLLTVITLSLSTTVFALAGDVRPVQQSSLPQITFLGEGPQTFTVQPPLKFLIKTYQNGEFVFVTRDETTYEAKRSERVWTTNFVPEESIRLFHEERSYGSVTAGCVVNYVQIEDNPDNRRNTFYINDKVLQVVEQGWVTYGSFTVPEDGELTFYAEDSIGMVVELCQTVQTVTPGVTITSTIPGVTVEPSVTFTPTVPPSTATFTPTATVPGIIITPGTATPTVTVPPATATFTATVPPATATSTATATATATATVPANTATATATATATVPGIIITVPGVTASPTATATATATVTTAPPAASPTPTATVPAVQVQITATPIATPVAIPVTGDGPGPDVIIAISAAIIGLFALLAAAWWLLMRAYYGR